MKLIIILSILSLTGCSSINKFMPKEKVITVTKTVYPDLPQIPPCKLPKLDAPKILVSKDPEALFGIDQYTLNVIRLNAEKLRQELLTCKFKIDEVNKQRAKKND